AVALPLQGVGALLDEDEQLSLAPPDAVYPQAPGPGREDGQQHDAEGAEPERLIQVRLDLEAQEGAGRVPDAVVVAGGHPEGVVAGTKVVVVGGAPRA